MDCTKCKNYETHDDGTQDHSGCCLLCNVRFPWLEQSYFVKDGYDENDNTN
ncbi:MAG: hypothetical protein KBA02_07280 [Paludibacteraceae bacterium]|nr:hypothetical protein [Paludibacteraceae bacterium]